MIPMVYDTITKTDLQKCRNFLFFKLSASKNLEILEFNGVNLLSEGVFNSVLKAILNDNNHCSIKTINATGNRHFIHYNNVTVEDVFQEIRRLNPGKPAQSTKISIKY